MCHQQDKQRPRVELADIFSRHADSYIEQHGVSSAQHKAINAISRCRTAVLGGHVARCTHCGAEEQSYNSCRYRYCPKCQTTKQLRWLEARKAELLPTNYFHVVFTIPHELNGIASYNPSVIYNILFQSAWSTIRRLGQDKKKLSGQMGMLSFLHTWGQNLSQHIHLHCMIPGGALCDIDGQTKWNPSRSHYLFPNRVMSALFGKTFITLLKQAFSNKALTFKESIAALSETKPFEGLMAGLSKKSWNVYAKEPFKGAEGGLEYLARYVSKTAISNERIISCDEGKVSFKWRDYSDDNKLKIMTLDAGEFIRRFLMHILPDGFMRIRSFGFLANACKTKNISRIRTLLGSTETSQTKKPNEQIKETIAELVQRVMGINIERCKQCRIGRLEVIHIIKRQTYWDTS